MKGKYKNQIHLSPCGRGRETALKAVSRVRGNFVKTFILFFSFLILSACTSFDEDRANQFQSLTTTQQAHYWHMKNVLHLIANLKQQGVIIHVQGDEYEIILPTSQLFKGSTSQAYTSMKARLQPIVDLINAQSTPSVQVLAYSNLSTSSDRNYALTQSWAETVVDRLKQDGLNVGVVSAVGHGECDNIGDSALNNRIEIHYRIGHDN